MQDKGDESKRAAAIAERKGVMARHGTARMFGRVIAMMMFALALFGMKWCTDHRNQAAAQSPPAIERSDDLSVVPEPVLAMRAKLIAAGQKRDFAAMAALTDPAVFEFSVDSSGSPEDWWRASMAAGDRPGISLATLLTMPYAKVRDDLGVYYVWPGFAEVEMTDWTSTDRETALKLTTAADLRQMALAGGWIGWRTGIAEDGTWLYYLTGD